MVCKGVVKVFKRLWLDKRCGRDYPFTLGVLGTLSLSGSPDELLLLRMSGA